MIRQEAAEGLMVMKVWVQLIDTCATPILWVSPHTHCRSAVYKRLCLQLKSTRGGVFGTARQEIEVISSCLSLVAPQ